MLFPVIVVVLLSVPVVVLMSVAGSVRVGLVDRAAVRVGRVGRVGTGDVVARHRRRVAVRSPSSC